MFAGVLDVRYSTFAPLSASSWLRVALRLMGPSLAGRALPGGFAPGFHGCAPMMGGAVVVRNAESGGAVLVEVDERAVFGCCSPRWEIAGVNFYETASHVVRG